MLTSSRHTWTREVHSPRGTSLRKELLFEKDLLSHFTHSLISVPEHGLSNFYMVWFSNELPKREHEQWTFVLGPREFAVSPTRCFIQVFYCYLYLVMKLWSAAAVAGGVSVWLRGSTSRAPGETTSGHCPLPVRTFLSLTILSCVSRGNNLPLIISY